MSRALQNQLNDALGFAEADLEASPDVEPTSYSEAMDGVEASLQAQLEQLAMVKTHLGTGWLHASNEVETGRQELSRLGLSGVLDVADLARGVPSSQSQSRDSDSSVLESHGLLDSRTVMRRAVKAQQQQPPRQWPEWGFPEDLLRAWETRFAAQLPFFRGFLFAPGMLFGSDSLWWPPFKRRRSLHEGLDYALYADPSGGPHEVPVGTSVPCVLEGTVVASFQDFIRSTIIVRHALQRQGRVLHSVYGHVTALVRVGATLRAGTAVGKVGANTKTTAPPHLHLSAAWLDPEVVPPESWKELLDGRTLFGCPAAVAAAQLHARSDEERTEHAAQTGAHGSYLATIEGDAGSTPWRGSPAQMLRAKAGAGTS